MRLGDPARYWWGQEGTDMNTTNTSSTATTTTGTAQGKPQPLTHTQRLQAMYAAFGRGDIPGLLENLSEDVEWEYGIAPIDVPWLQPRRGRAGAAQFFQALQAAELHRFEVHAILEGPGVAVAIIDLDATVKATGRRITERHEAHVAHFDAHGLIARFRHCADTAQHLAAYRGTTTG
jgi:uncharacterized protein